MKKQLYVLAGLLCMSLTGIAQTKDGGLTSDMLYSIRKDNTSPTTSGSGRERS